MMNGGPRCRLDFKGQRCGYTGNAAWCDKTYSRCLELGNAHNWPEFITNMTVARALGQHYLKQKAVAYCEHVWQEITTFTDTCQRFLCVKCGGQQFKTEPKGEAMKKYVPPIECPDWCERVEISFFDGAGYNPPDISRKPLHGKRNLLGSVCNQLGAYTGSGVREWIFEYLESYIKEPGFNEPSGWESPPEWPGVSVKEPVTESFRRISEYMEGVDKYVRGLADNLKAKLEE